MNAPEDESSTSAPSIDSSITIDEEQSFSVSALVIDAVAAAAAITFTALLVQDALPFLK